MGDWGAGRGWVGGGGGGGGVWGADVMEGALPGARKGAKAEVKESESGER